jgi:hypothetical protein
MSTKYKATTTDQAYFIITTVGWVDDVFIHCPEKAQYCQEKRT